MMRVSHPRPRAFIAAVLSVLLVVPTAVVSIGATPAAANDPLHHRDSISCSTDSQGKATVQWAPPSLAPGVVVFEADASSTMTASNGLETEVVGGNAYARVAGNDPQAVYTAEVSGPPSTACEVGVAFGERPTNVDMWTAEFLRGRTGIITGTTRAAYLATGTTPPVPGALTAVWYRWHGGDGPIDFVATPQHGFGVTDNSDAFTSVGVAVFDLTDPFTPLAIGGDGVAQPQGGTGGTASLNVSSANEYLIAVFSAGGTGALASQYGYTAAGAFELAWNGPDTPPTALHDDIVTPTDVPVPFDVLFNDSDVDGEPVTFVGTQSLPAHGTLLDTNGAGGFLYTPNPGFQGTDSFDYEIADPSFVTATGTVTITVGGTAAAPANDNFANAQPIGVGVPVFGTTVSATLESGEPEHHPQGSGQTSSGSVWYSFVPAVDGYVSVGVQDLGAVFSPNLYAHTYKSTWDPATVAQLSDGEFYFAGDTYYIAVDSGSDARAPFRLQVELTSVQNDDFADRPTLEPVQFTIPNHRFGGVTHRATAEPGEPAHAGLPAEHSNWFELAPFLQAGTLELTYSTFTRQPTAAYAIDRNDDDGSLRPGVYTGDPSSFATLTPVAVSGTGPYSFHVSPGVSYYLAWDTVGPTRYFNFGGTFTPDQANPPPGVGAVHVDTTVEAGGLALGERACFVLAGPGGPIGSRQCVTSGASSIDFASVPLGSYAVEIEYVSLPSGDFVPSIPRRFVVPAAVPVDVTQTGITATVSVDVKTRKLVVGGVDPNGTARGPLCFHLQPEPGSAAPRSTRARSRCSVFRSPRSVSTSGAACRTS